MVVGQDRPLDVLAQAVAAGRVAHAYLLHGPAGVGKRAVALAFAQALQCERPRADGRACGACSACTRTARLVHPDVRVYLPFPRVSTQPTRDDRPGDYAERVAALAADPYAATDYRARARLGDAAPPGSQPAHRRIAIAETLQHDAALTPVEGRRTVGVLLDADRLNDAAGNALLKLVEEPPASVTLVLTAERLTDVLPTIASRCQRLRLDPLPDEAVEAELARRGVEPQRSALVARMAAGSMTRALELVGSDELAAHRALALGFLRAAYTMRPERLAPVVDEAAGLGRERLAEWLALVVGWIRDVVLARALGHDARLVNVDQAAAVHQFVARITSADLGAMAALADEAVDLVRRNVKADLVLVALGHALGEAMRGLPRPALVAKLDR